MKKIFWAVLPLLILAACSGGYNNRKLLIIADGVITTTPGNITIGDTSNGAANKEIDVTQSNYSVNNNGVKSTFSVPADAGYYIFSISKDTLFGNRMIEGKDYNLGRALNFDEQKAMIDSVKKILAGITIPGAGNVYLITHGQIVKLSEDAAHTQIFPPFIPPDDIKQVNDGKSITLFKFYAKDELQQRLKTIEDSYNANTLGGKKR